MTEKELREMYLAMQRNNFLVDEDEQLSFSYELGHSDAIAYHYHLINDVWNKKSEGIINLDSWFNYHLAEGLEFLLSEIEKESDMKIKVCIAYLAAQVLIKRRESDFYNKYCGAFLEYLILFANTSEVELRQKSLIAIGWIGTVEHIDLLVEKMLTDQNSLCRAWSASSLMQLSFNRVGADEIKKFVTKPLIEAIVNETNLFACGTMIVTAQELYSKKWISGVAVENSNMEKIEKARKSAVKFLSKITVSFTR